MSASLAAIFHHAPLWFTHAAYAILSLLMLAFGVVVFMAIHTISYRVSSISISKCLVVRVKNFGNNRFKIRKLKRDK